MLTVNHIGSLHIASRKNCQDTSSVFHTEEDKIVSIICDGCSSSIYSEVGAILFLRLFRQRYKSIKLNPIEIAENTFKDILNLMAPEEKLIDKTIENFLCFTISISIEYDNEYKTYTCGDGVIVAITKNKEIEYSILQDDPNYPKYLAYKFIKNRNKMAAYKDEEITFTINTFNKDHYSKVGVGSDGLEFMLNPYKTEIRKSIEKILLDSNTGNKLDMKSINELKNILKSNEDTFQDDFSLSIS